MTLEDSNRAMADALRMVLARVTGREETNAYILVPQYLCCGVHVLAIIDALLAIASAFGKEIEQITGDDLAERLFADVAAFTPLEGRS